MSRTVVSQPEITPGFAVLVSRFLREVKGGVSLGGLDHFRVSQFVDLLSASHDEPSLKLMTDEMVHFVTDKCPEQDFDLVAVPKRGNGLLGKEVAKSLMKPSIFVRDEILCGRWVEGEFHQGQTAVLVDDTASDGVLLADGVESLRKSGLSVKNVFALVCRTEGKPEQHLKGLGVVYYWRYSLSDANLGVLKYSLRNKK